MADCLHGAVRHGDALARFSRGELHRRARTFPAARAPFRPHQRAAGKGTRRCCALGWRLLRLPSPLSLALIFIAPAWGWGLLVAVVGMLGLVEYLWLAFPGRTRRASFGLVLGIGRDRRRAQHARTRPDRRRLALPASSPGVMMYVVLLRLRSRAAASPTSGLLVIGVLYTGLLLPHFYWLRLLPDGPQWVTFVIAVGMGGDSGGYFVEARLRPPQTDPACQPGQDRRGGGAGIVSFSLLVGVIGKLVFFPARGWGEDARSCRSSWPSSASSVDLGESVMKRTFGAKESGWIFPATAVYSTASIVCFSH